MLSGSQDNTLFSATQSTRPVFYNQGTLLRKINLYLDAVGGSPIDAGGYCHGLSLLWLKRMAKSRDEEFYDLIRMIIDTPVLELMNHYLVINKFIRSIDKKQNPENYPKKPIDKEDASIDKKDKPIDQTDVNLILKIPTQKVLDQTCLSRQLSELFTLSRKEGAMFSISNGKEYLVHGKFGAHTVAIYVRDSMFNLYDANYTSGRPKVFGDADALVKEIRFCLYSKFELRPPPNMPLEIKLLHASDMPYQFSMMESLAVLWRSFSTQLAAVNSYLPTFSVFSSTVQSTEWEMEADRMDIVYAADTTYQYGGRR